jgi:antitoxin (DNA-binding transcriptional repressor) of toxin-antitoxin stability system
MIETDDSKFRVTATEFKAKCLDLFNKLDAGTLTEVTVTRRGKPVAVVRAADIPEIHDSAWGFMEGTVKIAPGVDLTESVIDEEPDDPFIGKQTPDAAA